LSTAKKVKIGKVVKLSSKDTISVEVEKLIRHPVYKKVCRVSKKYLVHDSKNAAKLHNKVTIVACRPISKRKSWRLDSIIE
jgi:small subunit ribosomal protein S17